MNSAVIKKIEYKFQEADAWTELNFVFESAKIDQSAKRDAGGWIYTTKVPFKVAKNQPATVEPIATLVNRKAIYRVTDCNEAKYTLGTDDYKSRLSASIKVEGTPGSFNGRELEITCISNQMPVIE